MLIMLVMAITIADGRKGRSRTRYQVATAWPGMSERWDGLSLFLHGVGSWSWFVCWLSSWCWSIFISSTHAWFVFLISLHPKCQHDSCVMIWWRFYKFLHKMVVQILFLPSPSRILHVCSSWNSICTSRHRRLVFRYLVARSSTCPWTRWPIMFWILKHFKWYTLSEWH